MMWARAALAGGLLVLVTAFAIGTENKLTTSVMGQTQDCGPSISPSWLVSGTPDRTQPASGATNDERRLAAVCSPVIHKSRVLIVTMSGFGCLLALVGVSAIRSRGEPAPRTAMRADS
jgi:hypothetical protein